MFLSWDARQQPDIVPLKASTDCTCMTGRNKINISVAALIYAVCIDQAGQGLAMGIAIKSQCYDSGRRGTGTSKHIVAI